VCFAVLSLVGAGCGEFPNDAASARVAPTLSSTPSPIPREFLEIGAGEPAHESQESVQMAAPAPKSLDRWEWALRAKHDRLNVWTGPRGGEPSLRMSIDALNPWDQRIAFPIRDVHVTGGTTWYRVLLGIEPNRSNGWVRGDDVTFDRTRHQVVVDLSERALRHYRNGNLRHRFTVGIGAPETPTTIGRFFVWARLNPSDASGPYGTFLLGLSGFSEVLTDWPGGGRMAIHGTADPTDRGRRVSYGCPRVYNPQMNQLRSITMGTTVLIRR
jgi:hypothetical protein